MKTNKNRKLKGSVLFTVVSVMSLLIIFLTGTLVLAASANKRSHRSYSVSQTQYTARSVVDSVYQAIGASQGVADSIDGLSQSNPGPIDLTVKFDGASALGKVNKTTVEWVGSQKFYNTSKKKWEEKDLIKITAYVTMGGQTSQSAGYILKDPPQATTTSGGGAGFVTAGKAVTGNHTSAFGGTFFNIRENVIDNDSSTAYSTLNYNFTNKNYLTGDTFELTNGQIIEADFVVNGNLKTTQQAIFAFPNPGTGISVWGDLTIGSNGGGEVFQLTAYNFGNSTDIEFNDIPYIYVDGTISAPNQLWLGNGNFPLNIFCGDMQLTGGTAKMYADIYCMDETKTSKFEGSSNPVLYRWSGSVINKTKSENADNHTFGNFYSKGDLQVSRDTVFQGDVYVQGNVNINADTKIFGDLYVGGNLSLNKVKVHGNVICLGNATITDSRIYKDLSVKGQLTIDDASKETALNIYNDASSGNMYLKLNFGYDCYINDFHFDELYPGYTRQENTIHNNELLPGAKYYVNPKAPVVEVWDAQAHASQASEWHPVDKAGNVLDWGNNILYYVNETQYFNYEPYYLTAYDGTVTNSFTNEAEIYYDPAGNKTDEANAKGTYYTKWDNASVTVTEQYSYYDINGNEVQESAAMPASGWYYTDQYDPYIPRTEGVTFYLTSDPDKTPVPKSTATTLESVGDTSSSPYATVTKDSMYPEYAEKEVILGLKSIGGYNSGKYGTLPISDTQIVKTVKEIVNNVNINPYSNSKYEVPSSYLSDLNSHSYSANDLGNSVGTASNPITTSCKITGGTINNDVYFEPIDGTEIWVEITGNVSTSAGRNIIFKDEGKQPTTKLNFLLDQNVTLSLKKSMLVSEKMLNLFNDHSKVLTITNYDNISNPAGSVELEPAQIFIYTQKNTVDSSCVSTLEMSDGESLITGYIKAPYLDFKCLTGYDIKNDIYYNGARVNGYEFRSTAPNADYNKGKHGFFKVNNSNAEMFRIPVIGSLNVGEASELQNNWVVLFIDPNKNVKPPIVTPSATHWYQIIYYEEY